MGATVEEAGLMEVWEFIWGHVKLKLPISWIHV